MTQNTLAMASIPIQPWNKPDNLEQGFQNGTIFPELNKEFRYAKDGSGPCCPASISQNACREYVLSFAITDMQLYLDTHPDCKDGKAFLCDLKRELTELRQNLYFPEKQNLHSKEALQFPDAQNPFCCGMNHSDWEASALPWEGGL